jgi:hypothetical protein
MRLPFLSLLANDREHVLPWLTLLGALVLTALTALGGHLCGIMEQTHLAAPSS